MLPRTFYPNLLETFVLNDLYRSCLGGGARSVSNDAVMYQYAASSVIKYRQITDRAKFSLSCCRDRAGRAVVTVQVVLSLPCMSCCFTLVRQIVPCENASAPFL